MTETTRHTKVKDRDGEITHTYSYSRKDEENEKGGVGRKNFVLAILPKIFLLILFLTAVYLFLEVRQNMDILKTV